MHSPAPIRLRPTVPAPSSPAGVSLDPPQPEQRRKRGIIYVRVSKDRPDMISPELQVEHAGKLAEREDIEVVMDPIVDIGKSGRAFDNRSIADIIDMARRREFDVLILWIWSRFGRNLRESLQHLDTLTNYGIEVRAAREDFDGKTTIGKFAIAQMLNIAELESNQKSDSWKDTIERRRRAGLAHGSRGRFGYFRCDVCPPPERGKTLLTCPRCKDGILKIDRVTGPILASLYRRYAAGESVRGMVLWLKEQGVKHYTGTDIDAGALYQILDSGFGLGFVRYQVPELLHRTVETPDGGTKLERTSLHRDLTTYLYYRGAHDAVIDDTVECERLWDAYVERRLSSNDDKGHSFRAKYSVSGFLSCAGCHRSMHSMLRAKKVQRPWINGLPDPRDVLYRCTRHMKFKDCPGNGVYATLAGAEDAVVGWLRDLAEQEPELESSVGQRAVEMVSNPESPAVEQAVRRLREIEGVLAEITAREDRLTDAVLDGLVSADAARRKRAELETQRAGLRAEEADLKHQLQDKPTVLPRPDRSMFVKILDLWEAADHDDRRALLKPVIRTVEVARGRNHSDKYRVYAMWEAPPEPIAL
ncbi:recombinase family protein [Streptomyces sp. NPDC056291]|uniref:recombinase family protein n=1 Tax=Streptomyces sp. NPDC056291 TaxID=3345772 RepID=UPI0035E0FEE2